MTDNPFHYLLPVSPEDFVGRWPLVKSIAQDLTLNDGDSHAIIAGRRCGKSSILNAIVYQLHMPETKDKGYWITLPISFDFKSGADSFKSVEAIYVHLLRDIYRRVVVGTSPQLIEAWPETIRLVASQFLNLTEEKAISMYDFEEALGYIFKQLDIADQRVRLVLFLDEIDDALERPWTQALFSQLRFLIYSSENRSRIKLVVTGSSRFLSQVSTSGSPLWNVLKTHYLDPFDETGFEELTAKANDLPKEAETEIWLQSGGHPFLAQYLLHHLWDEGISQATSRSVEELAARFLAEQVNDIEGWARAIDVGGLEAYRILASINDWVSEHEILRAIDKPSINVKRGLMALCYHGFVLHDRGWSNYRRFGNMFKKWYDTYGVTFTVSLASERTVSISVPSHVSGEKKKGLTWLHLSDWHQKGKEFNREVVRDALLKDIRERKTISPDLAEIDFIIFSGDIAFNGLQEEYINAIEMLFNPILEASNVKRDRLFIVPGNHDLDRNEFELLPNSILAHMNSDEAVQDWLTNDKKRRRLLEPFRDFASFVTAYTGQDSPDYANIRKWQIGGINISLLGINSSWMCGRKDVIGNINDKGFVLIGEPQIYNSLKQIIASDIKIAVLHHPFDWLAGFDRNHAETYLMGQCDFILHGHDHKPQVKIIDSTSGKCAFVPAGTCYDKRKADDPHYINSYNFVHLDLGARKGIVFMRQWSDPRGEWIEGVDSHTGGKFEFSMPKTKAYI